MAWRTEHANGSVMTAGGVLIGNDGDTHPRDEPLSVHQNVNPTVPSDALRSEVWAKLAEAGECNGIPAFRPVMRPRFYNWQHSQALVCTRTLACSGLRNHRPGRPGQLRLQRTLCQVITTEVLMQTGLVGSSKLVCDHVRLWHIYYTLQSCLPLSPFPKNHSRLSPPHLCLSQRH
jgi:hypothetical protein